MQYKDITGTDNPVKPAVKFVRPLLKDEYLFQVRRFLNMTFSNIIRHKILTIYDIEKMIINNGSIYTFHYLESVNNCLRGQSVILTEHDRSELTYYTIYENRDICKLINYKILYNYLYRYDLVGKCTDITLSIMMNIIENRDAIFHYIEHEHLINLDQEFSELSKDYYKYINNNEPLFNNLRIGNDRLFVNKDNLIDYDYNGLRE